MAIGKCTVTFDKSSVLNRLGNATDKSLYVLGQQVLKDSNQYCPVDQNTLRKSSETASYMKNRTYFLVWDTPYARYQYYGVAMEGKPLKATNRPLKYTNINAHKMWAHYAKAKHYKEWQKLLQAEMRKRG